jgi:RHS repeat-associated protein
MGTCNISTQNGGGLQAQAVFDDVVLYPSPYMVVTPRGYTNHYYAGSERIASRIGNRCWTITAMDDWENPAPETEAREAFWNIGKEEYPFGDEKGISSPTTNVAFDEDYDQHVQYSCNPIYLPEVDVLFAQDMLKHTINCVFSYQNNAPVYYYHTDHLGSTSWITDETGSEQQFLAYLPYGEPLMDVHLKTYDERHGPDDIRYKFTGKERDRETGYDYMEQRYYYPPLSIWLRPDPLLDKYIHLSPYAYCNGNPQKYVDPEGLSTHTNEEGLVVAVYDDNDLNIYKHSNAKLSSWGDVYENHLTTDDAEIMGQSLHPMSFANQSKYNQNPNDVVPANQMYIDFGSTELGDMVNEVINLHPSVLTYYRNAGENGDWDFKAHTNKGSLLFGNVYASPQDAGNFLAGAIKRQSGIFAPIIQLGYGAYNISKNNKPILGLIALGTLCLFVQNPSLGITASIYLMNGEETLSQLSIDKGYNYVK